MPIYEYRCENGHDFEVMQKISDEPVQTCTACDAAVHRVFRPPAVHFKGSGFYNTDYGTRKRQREKQEASSSSSSDNGASSTSDATSSSTSNSSDSGSKDSGSKKTESTAASSAKSD